LTSSTNHQAPHCAIFSIPALFLALSSQYTPQHLSLKTLNVLPPVQEQVLQAPNFLPRDVFLSPIVRTPLSP